MIRVLFFVLMMTGFAADYAVAADIPVQQQAANSQASIINRPTQQNSISAFFHNLYMKLARKTDDDPDPTGTLVAPFADTTAKPAGPGERNIMRLSTTTAPLDQPHRSSGDLGDWLSQAMSETLSFNASNYTDNMKLLAKGMSPEALTQYNQWVTSSGILAKLQSDNSQLNGSVEEKPFLVNEGPVEGRYRWLFEVPVLISFLPKGTTALDKQPSSSDRKLIMTIQIGRVAESQLPDHVMIESWSVQDNKRKN